MMGHDGDRQVIEINSIGIAGGGVFLVLRHVHGLDGRVIRSRLVSAFADPEDAEKWRQTWNEEEMEFEERVETMYLVFEREADKVSQRGDSPDHPNEKWLEAGQSAVQAWMDKQGYPEDMRHRLVNADRFERARYYIEWIDVTAPGQVPVRLDVKNKGEEIRH